MQDEAQEVKPARYCGEHDRLVPLATHAEVMKLGNLTQESPSSVRADEATNCFGTTGGPASPWARASLGRVTQRVLESGVTSGIFWGSRKA